MARTTVDAAWLQGTRLLGGHYTGHFWRATRNGKSWNLETKCHSPYTFLPWENGWTDKDVQPMDLLGPSGKDSVPSVCPVPWWLLTS